MTLRNTMFANLQLEHVSHSIKVRVLIGEILLFLWPQATDLFWVISVIDLQFKNDCGLVSKEERDISLSISSISTFFRHILPHKYIGSNPYRLREIRFLFRRQQVVFGPPGLIDIWGFKLLPSRCGASSIGRTSHFGGLSKNKVDYCWRAIIEQLRI